MSKTARTPTLDRSRPYADVMHGDFTENETQRPRYMQDGRVFNAAGEVIEGETAPKNIGLDPKAAPAAVDTLPAVEPEEVEALLATEHGQELLNETRDTIVELVQAANGPVIAGEDAHKLMVAWLVKNFPT